MMVINKKVSNVISIIQITLCILLGFLLILFGHNLIDFVYVKSLAFFMMITSLIRLFCFTVK